MSASNNRRIDDNERTNSVGLFNTARSYCRSADHLNAANLRVTHPDAPVTFLYCHAIELYLKAYLRGTGAELAQLKRLGHRVADLAQASADRGLKLMAEQFEILSHLDDAEVALEARYIVTGFKRTPTSAALATVARGLDREVSAALSRLGLPVRMQDERSGPAQAEGFPAPDAPRQEDLPEGTERVSCTYIV